MLLRPVARTLATKNEVVAVPSTLSAALLADTEEAEEELNAKKRDLKPLPAGWKEEHVEGHREVRLTKTNANNNKVTIRFEFTVPEKEDDEDGDDVDEEQEHDHDSHDHSHSHSHAPAQTSSVFSKVFQDVTPTSSTSNNSLQNSNENNSENEQEEESGEDGDDEESDVDIVVETKKGAMLFRCSVNDGDLVIENIGLFKDTAAALADDYNMSTKYPGPNLDTIEGAVPKMLYQYLLDNGITEDVIHALSPLARYYEEQEYVRWLQRLQEITS